MTHHHHPGHRHPPASLTLSLLRLSLVARLGIAVAIVVATWTAVVWAL